MAIRIKNKLAAFIAAIAGLAILATGTFAWLEITQVGEMPVLWEHTPHQATARLHNNQQWIGENFGQHDWAIGLNSDAGVYVENFSRDDEHEIFVRVRLLEYMETGPRAIIPPSDPAFEDADYTPFVLTANRMDRSTWSVRTPADTHNFGNTWQWNFGGSKYFMPTFNQDYLSRMTDVKGQAIDPAMHATGEPPMDTRLGGIHAYPLEAGLNDFWSAGDTHEARVKYLNPTTDAHSITTATYTHTARRTLDAEVKLMSEWDGTFGEFWLWDDDGWAYWGQPLRGGDATGMFLNSFMPLNRPASQIYYAIIADMQAATIYTWEEEFTMDSTRPISNAGRAFMFHVTGVVGSTFTDEAGIMWRVLHIDAAGRKLIITEHVHGFGTPWHSSNPSSRVLLRNTDSAQPWLEGFWDTMGVDMRNVALEASNPHADVRTVVQGWTWAAGCPTRENTAAARTTPSNNPANASNGLFVLSIAEVNEYFGSPPVGASSYAPRVARDVGGTARYWWLRSPGANTTRTVAVVTSDGGVNAYNATVTTNGFRPALWIQP